MTTTQPLTNWGGNIEYTARRAYPTSIDEVCDLVATTARVKPAGSTHSFNRIADSPGTQVSLERLPSDVVIDRVAATVSVPAGVTYGELASVLQENGLALENLASLPHITVGGACATATHGSGTTPMSESVCGLDLVTADGSVLSAKSGDADFPGLVVNLGLLGVVTRMTIRLVDTFDVRQYVYENVPGGRVADAFDELMDAAYSVSLMTDWSSDDFSRVWAKTADGAAADDAFRGGGSRGGGGSRSGAARLEAVLGATASAHDVHPVAGAEASACTVQHGVPGPWHERLPHFRRGFTPSSGQEIQTEYLLPRADAVDAFAAIRALAPEISRALFVGEVRTVSADKQWVSPAYGRDSVAFHFTWRPDADAVAAILPRLDAALRPFGARPHWGKAFHPPLDLDALYPRLIDFRELRGRLDPAGKFANAFTDAVLGPPCG